MNLTAKIKTYLAAPSNVYLVLLSIFGLIIFTLNFRLETHTSSQWVTLYSLTGAVVLLNHFLFKLPPQGNAQSMDSAIYLACIFSFGMQLSFEVLLLSSIIYMMYERSIHISKHIGNFAIYSLMIIGTYEIFLLTGGSIGALDTKTIYPYIIALVVYFAINVVALGIFHFIAVKGNLFELLDGMRKEIVTSFISTLLFSFLLTMLFDKYFYFGLFVFLVVAVLLSFSFRKLFQLYQEVSDKATRDHRTGLYNHGYFEELLEKELNKAKTGKEPFSLVLLDVDSFQKYNDTFGHLQGDKLLDFFGRLLKQACDPDKYIVARHGGDEFTILMPGKLEKEAFSFINALRKKINDSYFEGVEILPHGCLTFSAGIVQYKDGIYDKAQMLDKADQAMYYSKVQGKNLVHIYNEQSQLHKEIDIEQDILEIEQQLKIFLSKDIYTFQHSRRVFAYAIDLCEYINLSDVEKKILILGALFHDIGKLEVPKHILQKKEKLTTEEWNIVKKHVEWGKDIVSAIGKYNELLPLIELHHERIDGKGYPHGLVGEEIPKLARILSVIDSFDAMTTERPYQTTKTFDEAIGELKRCAGQQFDPIYVELFIQMIKSKYEFKLEMAN
ncbi:diguanylate cyclase [Paenibacillus albiflavus]|uniref:Diguanylate cyclase n=1 Tax=Paenibacillus albiflavus TaxID=2545760 RepID=A0A4R4E934_9BACL|nr:diguanylate cyclase [Paenibacillus albiflavus]TCZ76334.1 diguanylate cyclase [Paenibacillus albiflavus]